MTEPPDTLTQKVMDLSEAVARLESRVAALEAIPRRSAAPVDVEEEETPARIFGPGRTDSPATLLGLVGQTCLILGGAFLIRAFTDAGSLPKPAGVGLGLAYALVWAALADRAGRAGKDTQAVFLAWTAACIAYPMVLETTLKLEILSPVAAALALALVTSALLAVAWRRSLHITAWAVVLLSLGSGLAVMAGTASLRLFAAAFMGYGGAILWLTYGRQWHGLRWPVALAANGTVLLMDLLAAWPGGPPEAYRALTPPSVIALSLALVVVYLGSTVVRTLQLHRAVTTFEVIQTIAVLVVGFGGAVRVAQATGSGSALLGASALPVGAACYLAAFLFMEGKTEAGANFRFYATLALVFILGGCLIALPPQGLVLSTLVLGVLAALLGHQFRRATLITHCGILLTTAAVASGLVGRSLTAFAGRGGVDGQMVSPLQWITFLGLGGIHGLLMLRQRERRLAWHQRLGSFAVGTWALCALSAWIVAGLTRGLLGATPDAGALAALRTGVLSAAALGTAGLGRWAPASELRWLAYPLLGLTAVKLLAEDLGHGRPLTLFLAFTFFGTALTLVPLLQRHKPEDIPGQP